MPACRDSRKLSKISETLSNLYDMIRTGNEKCFIGSVEYFSRAYKDKISSMYDDDGWYIIPSDKLNEVVNLTIDEILTITSPFSIDKEYEWGWDFVDKNCNKESGLFSFGDKMDGKNFMQKLLWRCYNDMDNNFRDEVIIPHRLNIIEIIRKVFEKAFLIYKDNTDSIRGSNVAPWEGLKQEVKDFIKRYYSPKKFEGYINEFVSNLPIRPITDCLDSNGNWIKNRNNRWAIIGYHYSLANPLNRADLDSGEVCFGVEWECDAHTRNNFNKFMKSWVDDNTLSPRLNTLQFVAMSDGSLSGGCTMEFVGCPLTYDHAIAWYEKFQKRAYEFGYTSSYETNHAGIHIHISRDYFKDEEEIWRLSKLITSTSSETYLKWFGRGPSSSWCQKSIDEGAEWEIVAGKHRIVDTRSRYVCVNVENEHTIEIRCFDGKTNIVEDLKLVKILLDVVRSYNGKRFLHLQAIDKVNELFNNLGD